MKYALPLILLALPAVAEEKRQLDAHEHGVGTLNIAVDGQTVAMEFHAPGADIVGFEYEATSAEDLAAIEDAVARLTKPLTLFGLPDAAGCTVTKAAAALETEYDEGHDHDDHAEDKHDDHDHDEAKHDDHDHDDHAEEKHDDHDHEEHAEHDHDDHDAEAHAEGETGHTEFHGEYALTCADPGALTSITFSYFETFENALEVEVQIVSDKGAQAFEVERDDPVLDLSGAL